MPTQEDFTNDFTFEVFEDLFYGAELKTRNPRDDPRQREVITDRGRASNEFKATARLAVCVHGFLDSTISSPVPASLIVFEFTLNSLHRKHTYRSLYTSLAFNISDPNADPKTTPQIIAFAPFEKAVSAHGVDVEKKKTKNTALQSVSVIGPGGAGATIGGNISRGLEQNYKKRYTQLLQASRHISHDGSLGYDTAWWNMRENEVLHDGIPTSLRIAVLLQRASRDEKFVGNFTMKLDAGVWYKVKERWNDFWGLVELDDPVIFDPSLPPLGEMEGIDPENLGALRNGEDLQTLGAFWNPVVSD